MIGNGGSGLIVKPADAVYQIMSTNGDGTGILSQNVLGTSGSPILFFIQPPSDEKYRLRRMNLHAIDGNWNNASNYGALTNPLPNGIRIYVRDDSGIIKEYTSDTTIKKTHDWAFLAGVDSVTVGAAGADPLIVRWTFERGASDIILDGSNNERLVIAIEDDLTDITEQVAMVQGYRIKIA